MKTGLTLTQLAQELDAQKKASEDFVVDSSQLTLLTPREGGSYPEIHLPEGLGEYRMTRHATQQLADRISFPYKLWERYQAAYPDMLDFNVNELMRREPKRRMVRAFDWTQVPGRESQGKTARAILSDRYRRMDNFDLAGMVIPILQQLPGARFESMDLTERRMYIKVVTPRIQGDVLEGDTVCAGVVIGNSEVGSGSLSVQPMIFRLVCTNGMIAGHVLRRYHTGRPNQVDDETYAVLTDETREADDKALMLTVRDTVQAAVSETAFNAMLVQMREAAGAPAMKDPVKGVERLAKKFDMGETEQASVLAHLIEGGDISKWGALNAVTRTAQDVESYDRATELEEAGGVILNLSRRDWDVIAA